MNMIGYPSQEMMMNARHISVSQQGNGASGFAEPCCGGKLFDGNYPPFGAILTLEEIADRYGLKE